MSVVLSRNKQQKQCQRIIIYKNGIYKSKGKSCTNAKCKTIKL